MTRLAKPSRGRAGGVSHGRGSGGEDFQKNEWAVEPFVTAPYVADADGRMRPAVTVCECVKAKPGERCDVVGHGFRRRKTGPEFPVATYHCREHRRYVTVYPMGHVPYGRVRMAPVDERGFPSGRTLEDNAEQLEERWCGSVWNAAVDAVRDKPWSREGTEIETKEPARYGTQRRWLRRCACLVGLAGAVKQRVAERLRNLLAIDGLEHERLRHEFPSTDRLAQRARLIVAVVVEQPLGDDLWWRWLAAGALGGAWGEARIFEPSVGRLVSPSILLKSIGRKHA